MRGSPSRHHRRGIRWPTQHLHLFSTGGTRGYCPPTQKISVDGIVESTTVLVPVAERQRPSRGSVVATPFPLVSRTACGDPEKVTTEAQEVDSFFGRDYRSRPLTRKGGMARRRRRPLRGTAPVSYPARLVR